MTITSQSAATRILHTMLRVRDLDATLKFYVGLLGMRLLRRDDYPEGRFTLAFVGYGSEETTSVIEFTHNWDTDRYELGTGYGHIALAAPDVHALCERLKAGGAKITRPAGPMKHGTRVIGFFEDPDGYKVELVQRN
ncbi:MAG: lactoylglutathione lyase [Betaproteobacteria bacterium]